MRKAKKKSAAALSLLITSCLWIPLFSSCALFPRDERDPYLIRPEQTARFIGSIRPVRGDAEGHYRFGLYLQERNKHKQAIEEFKTAAGIDPGHVKAWNAMGVSHDHLGEFESSVAAYRAALRVDSELDYVHNNLGYAHLLSGRPEMAVGYFQQAIALNGGKRLYLNNLGRACAMQGRCGLAIDASHPDTGEAGARESQARVPDPKGAHDEAAKPAAPVKAPTLGEGAEGGSRAEGVLAEIFSGKRLSDDREGRRGVRADDKPVPAALPDVRIEVSNGNGINLMARGVGEYLRGKGFLPVRLTNAAHFNWPRTCVYYRDGHLDQARQLSLHLPGGARMERLPRLSREKAAIRLVIGQDLAPYRSLFQNG